MRQTLERRVIDQRSNPARGLLDKAQSLQRFELVRLAPSPDLVPVLEHFWMVLWTLGAGETYTQQNLPHPTQHLVIDPAGRTGLFGLMRGSFSYEQSGTGRVIGAKFRPGALHGFLGRPVAEITDQVLPAEMVFDATSSDLVRRFTGLNDPASMADDIEGLLRRRMPAADRHALEAEAIVALIDAEPDIVSVARLALRTGVSARTLQRLFETYVGIGPKWVIDRYRMIEAVEALNAEAEVSLTALAHALGYFDQAHFSKAFLAVTGKPPSHFRRTTEPDPRVCAAATSRPTSSCRRRCVSQ